MNKRTKYWAPGRDESGTIVLQDFPTRVSELTNDTGFITAAQAPVQSVNGKTGAITDVPELVFLGDNVDFNTVIKGGMYRFQTGATPATGIDYGQLLVVRGSQDTCAQIVFPYVDSASWSAKMRWGYGVTGSSPTWGDWRTIRDSVNTPGPTYSAVNSSTVSAASATDTVIKSVSLAPGIYIFNFGASFAANETGSRLIAVAASTAASNAAYSAGQKARALSGETTWISLTTVFQITSTTTYYCIARQNSGSALNVTGAYRYIKLA